MTNSADILNNEINYCENGADGMVDPEQIAKMLKDHERRLRKLETASSHAEPIRKEKKGKTRLDLLAELKTEGFFKEAQFIGAIAEKCTEMSYYTSSTDLTKPLQIAVRSGLLRRIKNEGKWAYVAGRLTV